MKATILFEVTEKKTMLISTSTTGKVETLDITGTDIEKEFCNLLDRINKHKESSQILDFLDISKWKEQ